MMVCFCLIKSQLKCKVILQETKLCSSKNRVTLFRLKLLPLAVRSMTQ
jgi:hypothetical protein